MVELVGVPKVKQYGWTQGEWPKESTEVLLHVVEEAESDAELKGLGIDSPVTEHTWVNSTPKMHHLPSYLQAPSGINP